MINLDSGLTLQVLITIISVCIVVLTFKNSMKKDIEHRAEQRGRSDTKLDSIDKRTESISNDVKNMDKKINSMNLDLHDLKFAIENVEKKVNDHENRIKIIENEME